MQEEYFFSCPYCWSRISVLVDLSVARQQYVEDCEVCCRPMEISLATENGAVTEFDAQAVS